MICIHHVGGRAGSVPLPQIGVFRPELEIVYYDADKDAVKTMPDRTEGKQHILPFALGGKTEQDRPFYILRNRFGSSLLPPVRDKNRYVTMEGVDFDCDQDFAVIEQRKLDVTAFDELWAAKPGMESIPKPDVLSLDTQGTEHEILSGATRLLTDDVLAVICEVEFIELYEGQPLFQDVQRLLEPFGLGFIQFFDDMPYMSYQSPLGMRGVKTQIFSNALFLRKPESLAGDRRRLRKLAFIAFVMGHVDIAWQALGLAGRGGGAVGTVTPTIDKFLDEVEAAFSRMPAVFPPRYHQLVGLSELDAFDACTHPEQWRGVFKFKDHYKSTNVESLRQQVHSLATASDSPLETVLRAYGLDVIANTVSANRQGQAADLLKNLEGIPSPNRLIRWLKAGFKIGSSA